MFIVLSSIKAWASLLLAEKKDIITIYGIFYFDREVIFRRYILVEGIQMDQILNFLIAVYIVFALWELFMCLRSKVPGSLLTGFLMITKVLPFFVETTLILNILKNGYRFLKLFWNYSGPRAVSELF